jgi:hypothetical protein
MVTLQEAFYEERFKSLFYRTKGTAFQEFFEQLMGLAYKSDFMACRPWGNRGDRKNDGYQTSSRTLFQVYAPYDMKEAKCIKKINEDFEGAREYWGTYLDRWCFVHNAYHGLPPHVIETLLELSSKNTEIEVKRWGLDELLKVFRLLSPEDKESWFGPAPSEETKATLTFKDIQVVLENIKGQNIEPDQVVRDVPRGKIEANALSDGVAVMLKAGMAKTFLVSQFYEQWHDPTFGEEIAASFRAKYETLRDDLTPNQVFEELQAWVGGDTRGTPQHELAVLTVLAYYFERCDIFEEPRSEDSS